MYDVSNMEESIVEVNPSDWTLLHMIQAHIERNKIFTGGFLHGISKCTTTVIQLPQSANGVYLLSNGEKSKLFGARYCHSAWGCPVCEPFKMAKKAALIGTALDAMEAQKQVGIMITFTVPHHTQNYSCDQVSEILKNTWYKFTYKGKKTRDTYYKTTKSGERRRHTGYRKNEAMTIFREELNCRFYARAYEYTWGSYGWHPHIHAIFWVDKNKSKNVLQHEAALLRRWRELAYKETLKVFKRDLPPDKFESFKDNLDARWETCDWSRKDERNIGVYISKKNNKPIIQKSSMYICGWGADKELTGNFERKASAKGHYTPYQMLLEASKYPWDSEEHKTWCNRYLEFTIAAKNFLTTRVSLGNRKEFFKIINAWKQTNAYIETFKKKVQNDTEKNQWYIVYWFSAEQYQSLVRLKLIPCLMTIANLPNAKEVINNLLEQYDIKRTSCNGNCPLPNLDILLLEKFNPDADDDSDCA